MESLLCPLGYVVTRAMDGDDALDLLKSRDYLPDLVLLDVQMFEKSGYEVRKNHYSKHGVLTECLAFSGSQVCEQLRNDYSKSLPVIMISSQTDEASILRGLQVSPKLTLNACTAHGLHSRSPRIFLSHKIVLLP